MCSRNGSSMFLHFFNLLGLLAVVGHSQLLCGVRTATKMATNLLSKYCNSFQKKYGNIHVGSERTRLARAKDYFQSQEKAGDVHEPFCNLGRTPAPRIISGEHNCRWKMSPSLFMNKETPLPKKVIYSTPQVFSKNH